MPADKDIQGVMMEKVTKERVAEWNKQAKLICGDEYVSIRPIWSMVNGEFTSDQLRGIADLMDDVTKECVTGRFSENVMKVAKEVKLEIESNAGQTEGKNAV